MLSKVQGTKASRDFLSFTPLLQPSGGFRQNKLLATVTRSGFPGSIHRFLIFLI